MWICYHNLQHVALETVVFRCCPQQAPPLHSPPSQVGGDDAQLIMRGCEIISLLPQVPKVRIAVRSTAVLSSSSGCPANRLWGRPVYSHRALLLSITLRGNTSKRRRNNIGRPWLDDGHFLLLLILSLPVYWTFGFLSLCFFFLGCSCLLFYIYSFYTYKLWLGFWE